MSLDDVRQSVGARLDAKHRAREVGLSNARQAIRRCANAIRAVHRGDRKAADALLVEARELLDVAEATLAAHPDVYYAGFLQDAQKEYAEAQATRALVTGEPLPPPEDSPRRLGSCAGICSTCSAPAMSPAPGNCSRRWRRSTRSWSTSTSPTP